MTKTRKRILIGAAAIVLLGAAGIVGWLLFSGNAPEEATLGGAVGVVQTTAASTTTADGAQSGGSTTAAPAAGVDGLWTVDNEIGEFSFQEATSTFVGFRVDEELRGIGSVEAVGRTPNVSGSVEITGSMMTAGTFTVDLASLTTDRSQRDGAVRRALDTATFPTATFEISEPVDFGSVPVEGTPISVTATGDLTIKDITQQVEFDLEAQLVDDVIVVVGQIPVVFADFDVAVPSAPAVLSAADNGVIELQLFLTR